MCDLIIVVLGELLVAYVGYSGDIEREGHVQLKVSLHMMAEKSCATAVIVVTSA